jgi:hypothetical protein
LLVQTIAIIGATEESGIFLAKQLAERFSILLFDEETEKLLILHDQMSRIEPLANVELMNCVRDASWEADVIIVLGYCCTSKEIANTIQKFATGKIVILIAEEDYPISTLTLFGNLQPLLPHSKLARVSRGKTNGTDTLGKEIVIETIDPEVREAVGHIFSDVS